jgi:hypothetical protein
LNSILILLNSAIDYAGLFPPAGLDMPEAVRNYAAYRDSERAWALGRLIVPVSRLDEFEDVAGKFLERSGTGRAWRLSALGGSDRISDLKRILDFNQRHSAASPDSGAAVIDTLELKARSAEEIGRDTGIMVKHVETYFEVPIFDDTPALIAAVAGTGGRAKVRTGGVTPDLFPSAEDLGRFISLCAGAQVPFKATAGLHHPIRSIHRLNYDPLSPTGMMHGFLNLFLAAAFLRTGMSGELAEQLLTEEDIEAFSFAGEEISWRARRLTCDQLLDARRQFVISFGSCSFEEPLDDLKALHLL